MKIQGKSSIMVKKDSWPFLVVFLRNINNQLFVSYEMNLHFLFHMKGHQNPKCFTPCSISAGRNWGSKRSSTELGNCMKRYHKTGLGLHQASQGFGKRFVLGAAEK